MLVLVAVAVMALSYLALAPFQCVGYCEDFDQTVGGRESRCLSSCSTAFGYGTPLGHLWLLVPVAVLVALWLRFARHR
jgi:hypothetical protein